jgi:acyl carrier protein
MTRDEIIEHILQDDDLREEHEFDSIDAVELLLQIEKMLDSELTQEEKKQAMDIRTINQICDYIEGLVRVRQGVSQ